MTRLKIIARLTSLGDTGFTMLSGSIWTVHFFDRISFLTTILLVVGSGCLAGLCKAIYMDVSRETWEEESWQGIDAAPKDGRAILVYYLRPAEFAGVERKYAVAKWDDGEWVVLPTRDFRVTVDAFGWKALP